MWSERVSHEDSTPFEVANIGAIGDMAVPLETLIGALCVLLFMLVICLVDVCCLKNRVKDKAEGKILLDELAERELAAASTQDDDTVSVTSTVVHKAQSGLAAAATAAKGSPSPQKKKAGFKALANVAVAVKRIQVGPAKGGYASKPAPKRE